MLNPPENQKKALRQYYQALRQSPAHQETQASSNQRICAHLSQWIASHPTRFSVICGYVSIRGEVDLRALWDQLPAPISIGLPVIQGQEIAFHPWKPGEPLIPNPRGIPEPTPSNPVDLQKALILTPALALSPSGQRLGYGGGFYDRFAAQHPEGYYLGITWGAALAPELPEDPWDLRVDGICQESGITLLRPI